MTEKDKELLLKDICARLPYFENWVQFEGKDYIITGYGHRRVFLLPSLVSSCTGPCPLIEEVKPYLRSVSSMTEEEERFVFETFCIEEFNNGIDLLYDNYIVLYSSPEFVDWLNAHHFDFRNLIEKGLALEAPEGMYKIE